MTEKWIRDTGLIFALLCLFIGYSSSAPSFLFASALILLLLLFAPALLWPLGRVWLLLSEVLGYVMNRVILAVIFFGIITPIAFVRRLIEGDARDLHFDTGRATGLYDSVGEIKKAHITKPY